MRPVLLTVAWLLGSLYSSVPLYWFVVHPLARFWRSRSYSPLRILLPVWLALIGGVVAATAPWHSIHLYTSSWPLVPALLLGGCGVSLYRFSTRGFSGTQVTGQAEYRPKEYQQRLVTSGIRSRVRHPIYLGHFCNLLALAVATGLAVLFALAAISVFTGGLMVWLEDRELERRFGAEYADYRRRVPAILPRF